VHQRRVVQGAAAVLGARLDQQLRPRVEEDLLQDPRVDRVLLALHAHEALARPELVLLVGPIVRKQRGVDRAVRPTGHGGVKGHRHNGTHFFLSHKE
jgi:hypothetical protein